VDCYAPGRVCVFPKPSGGEEQRLESAIYQGSVAADFEGVESVFDHAAAVNAGHLAEFNPELAEEMRAGVHRLPVRDFLVLRVREGREEEVAGQLRHGHALIDFACPDYFVSPTAAVGDYAPVSHPLTEATADVAALLDAYAGHRGDETAGEGVRIAIVDSGLDQAALPPTAQVSARFDAFASLASQPVTTDHSGHGSAVAAVINHIAPASELVIVRVFSRGHGSLSTLVNGLLLVAALPSVDVVNLSLSGNPGACLECGRTARTGVELALERLLAAAFGDPPLIVAAAGNRSGERPLAFPAKCHGVVAVGSFEEAVVRQTTRYLGFDSRHFFLADDGSASLQRRWRGTSFACAVVSGLAAVYASGATGVTPGAAPPVGRRADSMLSLLTQNADRSFAAYSDARHGSGRARLASIEPTEGAVVW
jgi:subtilisin family serine protease